MIFIDTEYNENQVLMLIGYNSVTKEYAYFDLRNLKDKTLLEEYLKTNKDEIFASYAVSAEVTALLRCGISVENFKCIDLMAEARMITMSHATYRTEDSSLLGQVRCLLKRSVKEDKKEKEEMRDLILSKEAWTDEEWDQITLYCYSDISELEELYRKIIEIHAQENHPYHIKDILNRGEYIRMCAEMDYESPGFPVDVESLEAIFSNKSQVKTNIIHNLPHYWKACFKRNKDKWTLSRKEISDLINARNWTIWKRTETGMPILKEEYLKELSLLIPEVAILRTAMKSLNTLNSTDLRDLVKDGYVKPKTFTFTSVTGRNGLRPKNGYLLNLPAWLRKIIQPHTGMLFVGFDWSQQEIAIAAALSGDQQLLDAYASGDIYLYLAKLSGHVPEGGTKATHKKERDLFKALQLGLAYGKGPQSLGYDIWGIMRDDGTSLLDAKIKAQEIYNWHKRTFSTYWEWNDKQIARARLNGWIESLDGWVEWVHRRTKDTQLKNFPSQANGAVMLRVATKKFYHAWKRGELPVVLCSQHDAFWFSVKISKNSVSHSEMVFKKIFEILRDTSMETLNILVRSDQKTYGMGNEYKPESWDDNCQKLWDLSTATKAYKDLLN